MLTMLVPVINVKKWKLNEISCLFCDKMGDLVEKPKPQLFVNIQRASDGRKDDISEKINNNTDFSEHSCTWHWICMASYISKEKIRDR